jgi:hypothetical protein
VAGGSFEDVAIVAIQASDAIREDFGETDRPFGSIAG